MKVSPARMTRALALCALVLSVSALASAQTGAAALALLPYSGSDADFQANPDRGFRNELYLTLGRGIAYPGSKEDGFAFIDRQLDYYSAESPRVTQLYIYLCDYNWKSLDAKAFGQLEACLELLRGRDLRVLLRFAYEYTDSPLRGPMTFMLRRHQGQLGEWIAAHRPLFDDTVMAVQAGFIGLWGEWHTPQWDHSMASVLEGLDRMVPAGTPIQVRLVEYKNKAGKGVDRSRIGFHDDFLVGKPNKWNAGGADPSSRDYRQLMAESPLVLNDGEMPWGSWKEVDGGRIDGKLLAAEVAAQRLSTLSLVHNYREGGGEFNLARYKAEAITAADLEAMGLAFDPGWFTAAASGAAAAAGRSIYEYLRDHLGYRLSVEAMTARVEEGGGEGRGRRTAFEVTLANRGMAAPFGIDGAALVLRDPVTGSETRLGLEGWQPKLLPTGARLTLRAVTELPVAAVTEICVSLERKRSGAPSLPVRVATGRWEGGVNWVALR